MAGVKAIAVSPEIATGTSLKTLLQLVAPANQRLMVDEGSISFNGVSVTGTPILVEILRQTSAGTMSALTPEKRCSSDSETLQGAAQHTATAEPTAGGVLWREYIHPQSGMTYPLPFGKSIPVVGGTRLGLRVTAAAAVNAVARLDYEE